MKCLVVVDMQPYFHTADDEKTQNNIIKAIGKLSPKEDLIVFMEYDVNPAVKTTFKNITDSAKKFKHVMTVTKNDDDGGRVFNKEVWKKYSKSIDSIYMCGVNTDACVFATASTISSTHKKIPVKILAQCCNCSRTKKEGLEYLQRNLIEGSKNVAISKRVA